jgi:hypothetical protein
MPQGSGETWKGKRLELFVSLLHEGKSWATMANRLGVSKQRLDQIANRLLPKELQLYRTKEKDRKVHIKMMHKRTVARETLKLYGRDSRLHKSELSRRQARLFSYKKRNAQAAGKKWGLLPGDIVWPKRCPLLGVKIDYFSPKQSDRSPSFDQIRPGKGYIKGNVQIVSLRANRIKSDATPEELQKIAKYMAKFALAR